MKVVIMAGGKGLRFWPRSVDSKPKQFLALTSHESMLQQTYQRFLKYVDARDIYVVAGSSYLELIYEQLPCLEKDHVIVEPDQRDTGPCIALTARFFLKEGLDEVLITAPSDQYIPEDDALWEALLKAERLASENETIVTLGIVPTRPETGYGYIRTFPGQTGGYAFRVDTFMEKPNEQKAKELFQQSDTYWNSGICIWKPSTIAHYLRLYQSDLWEQLYGAEDNLEEVYASMPRISVDYAILEKAHTIYTIPVDFIWDDIGSWTSLERVFSTDDNGNLLFGDVYGQNVNDSIIYTDHQTVIAIGIEDLIVVSTKDGLLVCRKSEEQKIKNVIKSMEPTLVKEKDQ
ncbi:mannose-1-phosphate guanylyltransferase [Paenibacillus hexagrammi]|uniref:NTP transferase domain-containing protein n=1 Tax=Paenibacillus hexagrammi TaxID=2908839 RepID=A0ABY3SDW0_9BACL|nr:sugar phosphate nucleotidyltransferase [Paenibacillus sp. YPD9-1]UJF32111.1 NTP transferase domain-containing protein [Paenibacillus sp. YPD9-1]